VSRVPYRDRAMVRPNGNLSGAACRRLFDIGQLPLDGSEFPIEGEEHGALVPISYLWFRVEDVVAFMGHALRDDLEVVTTNNRSAHKSESTDLRLRCREDLYDLGRRGRFVRFDTVDKLFCKWGLRVDDLGEPLFTTHPQDEPREQRREVLAWAM